MDVAYRPAEWLVKAVNPKIVEPDVSVQPGCNIFRICDVLARVRELESQQLYRTVLRYGEVVVELDPFGSPAETVAGGKAATRIAIALEAIQSPLNADPGIETVRASAASKAVLAGSKHQVL